MRKTLANRSKQKKQFEIYGIFGYPLGHTLSPAMQEAGFRKLGREVFYLVFEMTAGRFKSLMGRLNETDLQGFNVTIPYKETVIPFLDRISPEAKQIGAVNTVYRKGRQWHGANTDVYGFVESLRSQAKFRFPGRKALVLGAGGAARAVLYGLAREGISEIRITDALPERARKLVRQYQGLFRHVRFEVLAFPVKDLAGRIREADLVVNATPVGLKPADPVLVPGRNIPPVRKGSRKVFFDLIYYPSRTPFLKVAAARGHKAVNGLDMLVLQGARALECWTGRKAPVALMRTTLIRSLREREKTE